MNAGVHTSGMVGAGIGFLAAIALAAYTRNRMAHDDPPNTPALEMVPVVPTQQQIVQIQVPPNSYPGMPVQVRIPDGRIVSVQIPEGTMQWNAGQIIRVAVPVPAPTAVSSEQIPVAEAYQAERVSGAPLGEEQCVICQDAIRGGHERLPCSHVFHRACLERWLRDREHRFCPICKKPV